MGAIVVFALVNVDGAVVLIESSRTVAYVTTELVQAVATVFAVVLETQTTADVFVTRRVILLKSQVLLGRKVSVLVDLLVGEVVQEHVTDSHFAQASFECFT